MAILSKDTLLKASDIQEREIPLPSLGGSVRVRSLPAAYSNEASTAAFETVTVEHKGRPQQTSRVNAVKLEELKVLHGLIDPKLASIEEARLFSQQVGRAWKDIVRAIDELSGLDEETVERTEAMFPNGGSSTTGPEVRPEPDAADAVGAGSPGPAVSV